VEDAKRYLKEWFKALSSKGDTYGPYVKRLFKKVEVNFQKLMHDQSLTIKSLLPSALLSIFEPEFVRQTRIMHESLAEGFSVSMQISVAPSVAKPASFQKNPQNVTSHSTTSKSFERPKGAKDRPHPGAEKKEEVKGICWACCAVTCWYGISLLSLSLYILPFHYEIDWFRREVLTCLCSSL
jgi:hypothetical protein